MNPLNQLAKIGQAVWLDDIHRDLMTSGELKRLIEEDDVRGLTSNPAIFKKAIAESQDYDEEIQALREEGREAKEIYEALAVKDVRMAADEFSTLYDRTKGAHGYVSLEVDPYLARDTQGTLQEAQRLWEAVNRPNVFIKVPATQEGLPAITELIGQGVNVNITLLFSLKRYREVAEAYLAGIERRLDANQPANTVRSVASFFLSRIDVLLDPKLEEIAKTNKGARADFARALQGHAAIASAKLAYQEYKEIVASDRWKRLAAQDAHPQQLLWASTSTKNPDESDVKYVEPLIGPETVNTMPMKTICAYLDHGQPEPRLEEDVENARRVKAGLAEIGIEFNEIAGELEAQGLEKFCSPLDALLEMLEGEEVRA